MNPIIQTLESMWINHKIYNHEAVFTVEEANKIEGLPSQGFAAAQIPAIHMKNLFLIDRYHQHHLVCLDAHSRLKIKDFGRAYELKDLTFASAQDMLAQLHVTPGSVSIFGIIYQTTTKLYIDPVIIDQPAIWRHPNDNTMTAVLSYQELIKFLHIVWVIPTILKDWLI